ncbi:MULTISPECIES: hypothetical protein [Sphingobium]|uniref:hypothetical protein n=1 Tax=Sphingobium TaxID=165695 RepID=UPI00159C8542|nr:hypothetical protein [Sphingobium sp. 15-1]
MPDLDILPTMDECVTAIAEILNACLIQLDELCMWQAGAHVSQAIAALPGQATVLPLEFQDASNLSTLEYHSVESSTNTRRLSSGSARRVIIP